MSFYIKELDAMIVSLRKDMTECSSRLAEIAKEFDGSDDHIKAMVMLFGSIKSKTNQLKELTMIRNDIDNPPSLFEKISRFIFGPKHI